ncbi:MAG: hypothetical protein U9R39_09200 [Campylobacterota bacterium]|nr:hypothetical protein [Campylobacterota bacterium]
MLAKKLLGKLFRQKRDNYTDDSMVISHPPKKGRKDPDFNPKEFRKESEERFKKIRRSKD